MALIHFRNKSLENVVYADEKIIIKAEKENGKLLLIKEIAPWVSVKELAAVVPSRCVWEQQRKKH